MGDQGGKKDEPIARKDTMGSNHTSIKPIHDSEEEGSLSITSNIQNLIKGSLTYPLRVSKLLLLKMTLSLIWLEI